MNLTFRFSVDYPLSANHLVCYQLHNFDGSECSRRFVTPWNPADGHKLPDACYMISHLISFDFGVRPVLKMENSRTS